MNNFNELYKSTLRVTKEDSAFLYFQLESNEGLCFYSTIPHQNGDKHRDVTITCHISMKDDCLRLINFLSTKFPIEIL